MTSDLHSGGGKSVKRSSARPIESGDTVPGSIGNQDGA
jgi:hypothetical protein